MTSPQYTSCRLDYICWRTDLGNIVETNNHIGGGRIVTIMYDRTSDCTDLNTGRKQLFTKKSRTLKLLPPTSYAFIQHVKRSILQRVHCWGHCLDIQPPMYNPAQWGGQKITIAGLYCGECFQRHPGFA